MQHYYQSGMGEPGTYNGDFTRPVHIVPVPIRDVAIDKLIQVNITHDGSLLGCSFHLTITGRQVGVQQ